MIGHLLVAALFALAMIAPAAVTCVCCTSIMLCRTDGARNLLLQRRHQDDASRL